MAKLTLALIVFLVVSLLWWRRRVVARGRLLAIESGRMCIACSSTEVSEMKGVVRCQRCGYQSDLRAIGQASLSEAEIRNLTSPD